MFAFAALAVIFVTASRQGASAPLSIQIIVAGGLIGWVVGILMTPQSPGEKSNFSDYGTAISTFVTGYLVAKIDRIFDLSIKDRADINELLIGRVLMFVSAFILGAGATSIWRAYISH
ncbi:hypothetical protein [Bradyrhizobium sp. NC92]|uniref:hypothetical protein n=1 Tax=Bradyrhizobium sp. (strain NC92) TaxID=55395 RepID=UPI0021A98394|nr:hypothetical protein [Bradyrhizobium sp. NC92]UWU68222.1 hypothetical protein N2602_34870 [Bradyrhizobium sp. NC92]